jgi:DNA-binding PadR family transcriptional regulator
MRHHHHHHDDPFGRDWRRKLQEFAEHGFGAEWSGLTDSLKVGRMLASGDLRLVALYFIELQPRHGYDLIKAIEEKTAGLYVPSPGVIYPALTFLEEAGFVTSSAEGNKRLYTITEAGRAHLSENRAAVDGTLEHLRRIGEQFGKVRQYWSEAERNFREPPPPPPHHEPDRDMEDVAPEVNEARRELKKAIKKAAKNKDPEAQRRLAGVLLRAADEIRRGVAEHDGPDIDL